MSVELLSDGRGSIGELRSQPSPCDLPLLAGCKHLHPHDLILAHLPQRTNRGAPADVGPPDVPPGLSDNLSYRVPASGAPGVFGSAMGFSGREMICPMFLQPLPPATRTWILLALLVLFDLVGTENAVTV